MIHTTLNCVNADWFYGHIKIVPTKRWEGRTLIMGGYSITYDQHGNEVSRTEDTENCRLFCPDEETLSVVQRFLLRSGFGGHEMNDYEKTIEKLAQKLSDAESKKRAATIDAITAYESPDAESPWFWGFPWIEIAVVALLVVAVVGCSIVPVTHQQDAAAAGPRG